MRKNLDFVVSNLKKVGLDYREGSIEEREVTLFLDDAQVAFGDDFEDFWYWLIKAKKAKPNLKKVRLIIAATEYLSSEKNSKTPWSFRDLNTPFARGTKLELTDDEMDVLFQENAEQSSDSRWGAWHEYRDTLKSISGGNAGAFQAGIIMREKRQRS